MLRYLCPAALAGMLLLAHSAAGQSTKPEVTIDNFTFKPASISVRMGTTLTFTNHDDIPHLVVATDGTFRSKALDTGDAFAFTFTKPGTFAYFCGLHPQMKGQVVVAP